MYCVQPYAIKRHRLLPGGALVFRDADTALQEGHRLARSRAGVVVLSQSFDAPSGRWTRPHVLAIHGQVPSSWRERAKTFDVA